MDKYILYCGGVLTCDGYDNLSGINGSYYSSIYRELISDTPTNPTDSTAFVYGTDNSLNVVHSCCSPKMKCTYYNPYQYSSFNLFNNIDNSIWSEEYVDNDDNLLFSFLTQYDEGNRLPHIAPSWFGDSINTVKYTFVNENDRYGGNEHNNVPSATTEGMFSGCTALTSCDVPCEMRYISNYTFSGCSSLTSYTTTPQFVEHIGIEAFKDCYGMNDILIGQYCSISTSSFENCNNAITITFDGVDSNGNGKCNMVVIPDSAFTYCTSLSSTNFVDSYGNIHQNNFLGLPNSVNTIGDYSFFACRNITSVILGFNDEEGCPYSDTSIGSGVTSIGDNAFGGCGGLTSVIIGSGVTSISSFAFYGDTAIETLYYNSIIPISSDFFEFDNHLREVVIGDTTDRISGYVFGGCGGLTSLTIGNSVTAIEDYAFENCTSLTSVNIPSSVTYIGNSAFCNCPLDADSRDAISRINPNALTCN